MIKIKQIDCDNKEVLSLKVNPNQQAYIEPIATCMEEAKYGSYGVNWIPVGFYLNEKNIGFAMYGISKGKYVWLDRFLIDEGYQHKGYGKEILPKLLDKISREFITDTIYLSVNKDNETAIHLYESFGFRFIDALDGEDPVMEWKKGIKHEH